MSASAAPAVPTQHTEGRFTGEDGLQIYWQSWLPEGEAKAVVVISHGASEHGGRYRYVVERLVPDGFAVYAPDHRGHGRSEGTRAQLDRMSHVVSDLDQLIDLAREQHPGLKLFLLGHSMGGCVAIAYTLAHQEKLDGLVLSAPVAALEAAPLPLRLIAKALSVVRPDAGVYEIASAAVSRDPEEVKAYDEDPLNYHGKLPARTVQELADTVARFEADSPKLVLPLLVLIGTADELVPPAGGQMVHDRAQSTDKTLKTYDGFYHEIFNEPAGERDRPLNDLAEWLSEHTT
ncbi:MAG: acylglycerol lipase [Solirubrobacteraceae bacterium]|jgi:lysophospholipase|nr:acylglycerol lipase [Solirubrobacteraceae bacterium]